MNYILINRKNIVIDIVPDVLRYIELQPNGRHVIICPKEEGTGVIGSNGIHYPLIANDITNNENAVRVMELEEIPSELVPNLFVYDGETNSFVYRYTLEEAQEMKQAENKALFAKYLESHPLTWVDGKEYGVTMEDQSEISLNLSQYEIAVAANSRATSLEWHARHEECVPWSRDNLVALSLDISDFVYPMYRQCQAYKIAIYGATSIEELDAIKLVYEVDESDVEETTE